VKNTNSHVQCPNCLLPTRNTLDPTTTKCLVCGIYVPVKKSSELDEFLKEIVQK